MANIEDSNEQIETQQALISSSSSCIVHTPSDPLFNSIDKPTFVIFIVMTSISLLPYLLVYYLTDTSVYDRGCSVRMDLIFLICTGTLLGLFLALLVSSVVEKYILRYTDDILTSLMSQASCLTFTTIPVLACMAVYHAVCGNLVSADVLWLYWILTVCMLMPAMVSMSYGYRQITAAMKRLVLEKNWKTVCKIDTKFMEGLCTYLECREGAISPEQLYLDMMNEAGYISLSAFTHMLYYRYHGSYSAMKPVSIVAIDSRTLDREWYDSQSLRKYHQGSRMHNFDRYGWRNAKKGMEKDQGYIEGICYICDTSIRHAPSIIQHPTCYHEFHELCFMRYVAGKPHCPRCGIDMYQSLKTELNEEISRKA